MKALKVLLFFAITLLICSTILFAQNSTIWRDVSEQSIAAKGERLIIPAAYRTLALQMSSLNATLNSAPMENSPSAEDIKTVLSIPYPDGTFENFFIYESPIMEPGLAVKFPEIRTFIGKSVTNSSVSARLDITPAGFHAMVFTLNGTVFIDPYSRGNTEYYISYYKRDYYTDESKRMNFNCPEGGESEVQHEHTNLNTQGLKLLSGTQLRTYRLACAATGEYTAFHGGTVTAGMAAIVTAMNRVVGIYEKEVAIRMVLVANNDLIVYTNASTDPYTNNNGSTMLGQNQTNLDAVIGTANYDIGHVFSTGGGGIAGLGVVCVSGNKARGVTGLPSPIGDPFYVDYVAHEIGHQYGAHHTFNGNAGSCAGANRNASTAYEPGSGSTIMAYAGICAPQDLQNNSDAYFHLVSINQIVNYTTTGSGSICPVVTATGNTPPVVTIDIGTKTIPISTPFSLTGSATDADKDPLTYCWEQWDLGAAGAPTAPVGSAPIFRSFTPVSSPTRLFPKISDIVSGSQTIGEILPTYTRALNFRLTARDNREGGGGIGFASASLNVTSAAGPFTVTSPNLSTDVWVAYTNQTVTWNVANTNVSPVSCNLVNILLSTDGGFTYPTVLAQATPNDGNESILVPPIYTSTARVKVEAADNLFFDISNANFQITSIAAPVQLFPPNDTINQPLTLSLIWRSVSGALRYHLQVASHSSFIVGVIVNDTTITDTFKVVSGLANNTKYYWRLTTIGSEGRSVRTATWNFTTLPLAPIAPVLNFPVNNAINQPVNLTVQWNAAAQATSYRLEVSNDSSFATIVIIDSNITTTSKLIGPLAYDTKHYWRVNAKNAGGTSPYSEVRNFTTSIAAPGFPILTSPFNNAQNLITRPTFIWARQITASSYRLQIATDTNFNVIVFNDSTITDTTKELSQALQNNAKYFWRVNAKNIGGTSAYSEIRSFRTIVALPSQPQLVSPADSAILSTSTVGFVWYQGVPSVTKYWFEYSNNEMFTNSTIDTTLTDTTKSLSGLVNNQTYWWRVKANNAAGWGSYSAIRNFHISATGIKDIASIPSDFILSQNYPNPFNPTTTFTFGVPQSSYVTLDVYNLLGQKVASLINGVLDAGYHETVLSHAELTTGSTSGVYFYRLQAIDLTNSKILFTQTKKLILMK